MATHGGTKLVFSYGANMAPGTLAKRSIEPISEYPARLADEDTCISFQHRAAFATLTSSRRGNDALCRSRPFGVVLELTDEDVAKLSAREVGYRRSLVSVERLDIEPRTSAVVEAFVSTCGMELLDGPLPPTARYVGLILDGLEHHGIERFEEDGGRDYVEWIRTLPTVENASAAAYGKTSVERWTKLAFAAVAISLLTILH